MRTIQPTAVPNLTAAPSAGAVALFWAAPESGGTVTGYDVYDGPTKLTVPPIAGRTYTASSLAGGSAHSFVVAARNGTTVVGTAVITAKVRPALLAETTRFDCNDGDFIDTTTATTGSGTWTQTASNSFEIGGAQGGVVGWVEAGAWFDGHLAWFPATADGTFIAPSCGRRSTAATTPTSRSSSVTWTTPTSGTSSPPPASAAPASTTWWPARTR